VPDKYIAGHDLERLAHAIERIKVDSRRATGVERVCSVISYPGTLGKRLDRQALLSG
jgi:hypothetical protein